MKRIDTYQMHQEIHRIEVCELRNAVKQFGGEIHFGCDYTGEYASDTERPMICVNVSHWDTGPEDVYVNAVKVDDLDFVYIIAETKEGDEFNLSLDDIEFGHISFITDLVPDKDKERTENKQNLIMETAVFMAWDMFDKMYNPEKGMGVFDVCHEIISLAKKFEDTRTWKVSDDDYDEGRYLDELDAFEKEYLKSLS